MENEKKTLDQLKAEAELAQKVYNDALKVEEQKKKEEANRKKAELELQKDKRKKEIEEAKNHYHDLVIQYIKDYGKYEINHSYVDGDDFISFLFGNTPFRFFS